MAEEFDKYSKNYKELLDGSLQITGFDTDHFAAAKIKTLAKLFPNLCNQPIDFLDYGCGAGVLYLPFKKKFPKATYAGTDLSDAMIEEARVQAKSDNVFFEMGSSSWKQRTYDIIFASCVFHHIPAEDHEKILRELGELLTADGKLIVWEHNPINPLTRKIVRDCPFDKDAVLISPGKMKQLYKKAGVSQLKVIFTTFFPQSLRLLIPLEPWLGWFPLGGQYLVVGEKQVTY